MFESIRSGQLTFKHLNHRAQGALQRRRERLAMRQNLIKEEAAKKLLDGSFTRMTSSRIMSSSGAMIGYGSCNLLAPLAASHGGSFSESGVTNPGAPMSRSFGNGSAHGGGCGRCDTAKEGGAGGDGGGGGAEGGGESLNGGVAGGVTPAGGEMGVTGRTTLGLHRSPRVDIVSPGVGSVTRSAPVSPAGSPRAGLVGSLSERSTHEFFDNW